MARRNFRSSPAATASTCGQRAATMRWVSVNSRSRCVTQAEFFGDGNDHVARFMVRDARAVAVEEHSPKAPSAHSRTSFISTALRNQHSRLALVARKLPPHLAATIWPNSNGCGIFSRALVT
jgi:hypothetical protein